MRIFKIACTLVTLASMTMACQSSSQEDVTPLKTETTNVDAAREPSGPVPGVVYFLNDNNYSNRELLYVGHPIKRNFGSSLADKVSFIRIAHYDFSGKKYLIVNVFENKDQKGRGRQFKVERRNVREFEINGLFEGKISSYSMYFSNN